MGIKEFRLRKGSTHRSVNISTQRGLDLTNLNKQKRMEIAIRLPGFNLSLSEQIFIDY